MIGAPSYTLFDTALGTCGIAWGDAGVVALQLPEADAARTAQRLLRRLPGSRRGDADKAAQHAIEGIVALLRGEHVDLLDVRLDMRGVPEFQCRVYDAARRIPAGTTVSYGELAQRIGQPGVARAVGQALGRNPFAPVVPCHRVLAAGGRPGGFSAHGGLRTKLQLLLIEAADPSGSPDLFSDAGRRDNGL
jgi:methylated-DNA-[protein]-cysteine S-methyltransferase